MAFSMSEMKEDKCLNQQVFLGKWKEYNKSNEEYNKSHVAI